MAIDPPVKTKVTVDPDTGARVFNQSWSSEIKKKQPIVRKPVSRDTFVTEKKAVVKPTAKPVAKESVEKTSGERKFSEVVVPKPAPAKGIELKGNKDIAKMAPRKEKTAEQTRREMVKFSNEIAKKDAYHELKEKVVKQYPNKTPEKAMDKYYRIKNRAQEKAERKSSRWIGVGNGDTSEKQRSGGGYGCPGGCH
jgi:hypothetical protein